MNTFRIYLRKEPPHQQGCQSKGRIYS